ncbi:MAG: transcriptional repressor [Phycisphaerae bacterium]|nr:transcriptional repressor [Phycisphaerae bacterium]
MSKKSQDNSAVKTPQSRMTKQRRIILEQMQTPNRHLTADEVYLRVRERIPNISMGTVYRNLELLVQSGKIKRLSMGGGAKQYDGGAHRHYHVRCVECGRVSDVSAGAFGDMNVAAAVGVEGFDIIDHELEFTGVCSKCQSSKPV